MKQLIGCKSKICIHKALFYSDGHSVPMPRHFSQEWLKCESVVVQL